MYKNQLQELAQRSCFNLPSYTCIREGPDHAPRFKAVVNFNGESFESPQYCSTLRQAEHSAAERALVSLSSHGASHSIASRFLDETGVYKNLLQEIAQRVGSPLPHYKTFRTFLGRTPVFTGTVELAGIKFTGEPAKNKKQAEKNAALAAWLSLKQLARQDSSSSSDTENGDEQEQIRIARAIINYRLKQNFQKSNLNHPSSPFQPKFAAPVPRPSSLHNNSPVSTFKILPLFTASQNRQPSTTNESHVTLSQPPPPSQRFIPYAPFRQCGVGIAPPVTVRTTMPVFSAPPLLPPNPHPLTSLPVRVAPPVCIRNSVPVFGASTGLREDLLSKKSLPESEEDASKSTCEADESTVVKCLEQLEI